MNIPLQRTYRLRPRGGAGLVCDEKGLALGGVDLASLRQKAGAVARCDVRSPAEVGQILQAAYGLQTDAAVQRLHRGLRRAAAWIEAGDLGHAGIEAVMLGLPDIEPEAMAKLARIAELEKGAGAAWEDEPRIPAGQTGGGQWTTGGGGTSAVAPAANVPAQGGQSGRTVHRPSSMGAVGTGAGAAARTDTGVVDAADRSLLVHVNTAATVVGGRRVAADLATPAEVADLGRVGLLAFGAALLDQWGAANARGQITNATARFGLDPTRLADVMAASAYVWSRYALPVQTEAPFSGPKLDAASQAVMRFVLVNPGAFTAMFQGTASQSAKSFNMIIDAANGGLADHAVESRARPPGVARELQTTSRSARAALNMPRNGRGRVHHLVPAEVWGIRADIATLAKKDGWNPDFPSNLIDLPANQEEFDALGRLLPMHSQSHPIYNADTLARIDRERSKFPAQLSPLQAHAILDSVALENRNLIMKGKYYPIVKVNE